MGCWQGGIGLPFFPLDSHRLAEILHPHHTFSLRFSGWQEYAIQAEKHLVKREVPKGATDTDYLGVLGMPGQTAYWGITDVGKIKPGELVVVSGAAGAVGTTVCQIAKLKGCRVVGIAGGKDKCDWLRNELGIQAIDYKSKDFLKEFKKIGYLDVYCESRGGISSLSEEPLSEGPLSEEPT